MKEKWLQLKNRFESLAVRERCLLVGAVAAVIYLVADFALLHPLRGQKQILEARQRIAKQELQTSEAELTVLSSVTKKDPNLELQRNLQELQKKLRQLDSRLDTLSTGLVAAEKLPQVLHYVLRESGLAGGGGLTIASMATLPPEEMLLSKETAEPAAAAVQTSPELDAVKIYKHAVSLKLEGDFVSTVRYLQALEQGQWRFYWDSLKYQVTLYPRAQMQLKVFTLSSQRGVFDAL
jgi:MSHA biogenesis protein MshJ